MGQQARPFWRMAPEITLDVEVASNRAKSEIWGILGTYNAQARKFENRQLVDQTGDKRKTERMGGRMFGRLCPGKGTPAVRPAMTTHVKR
jgi:hypothetical protein